MPSSWVSVPAVLLGMLFVPGSLAWAVSEAGPVVAHATVRGHDVPVYRIGELEAADTQQGMDGFAIRVAYALHAWTREHGVEAIGNLCRTPDGTRWGSVLLTVYAHAASPRTNACPAGMQAVGVDVHSHPQRQRYSVNSIDRLFLRDDLMYQAMVATRPDAFSADDYAQPGYVVGRIHLQFQEGRGRDRIVWDMGRPQPPWGSAGPGPVPKREGRPARSALSP